MEIPFGLSKLWPIALAVPLAFTAMPALAQLTVEDVMSDAVNNPDDPPPESRGQDRSEPLTLGGLRERGEPQRLPDWLTREEYVAPERRAPLPPPPARYEPPAERYAAAPPRSVARAPAAGAPTVPASGDWEDQAARAAEAGNQDEFGLGDLDF